MVHTTRVRSEVARTGEAFDRPDLQQNDASQNRPNARHSLEQHVLGSWSEFFGKSFFYQPELLGERLDDRQVGLHRQRDFGGQPHLIDRLGCQALDLSAREARTLMAGRDVLDCE